MSFKSQDDESLTVRDVMVTDVKTVTPEDPVMKAVELMSEHGIGSVVVIGPKREVLGILTERDLITRVLAKRLDPNEVKVQDIMSRPVVTIEPDVPLSEVVSIMKEKGIGHVPVVENGRIIGIIAEGDIAYIAPEFLQLLRIRK